MNSRAILTLLGVMSLVAGGSCSSRTVSSLDETDQVVSLQTDAGHASPVTPSEVTGDAPKKPATTPKEQGSMTLTWDGEDHVFPTSVDLIVSEAAQGKVRLELQFGAITLRIPDTTADTVQLTGAFPLSKPLDGRNGLDIYLDERPYSAVSGTVEITEFADGHLKGTVQASVPFSDDSDQLSTVTGSFDAFSTSLICRVFPESAPKQGGSVTGSGQSWTGVTADHPICAPFLTMAAQTH